MELSLIESFMSLGVGGVLGLVIFLMYRRDRKDTEKRWSNMVDDLIETRREETESREANTKASTELTILMKSLNGKVAKILEK